MTQQFYVSPEQLMKDRADFARKGIARGRSVVVVQYADGVLFASENPSQALHKISEIYDRIAFAAVGPFAFGLGLETARSWFVPACGLGLVLVVQSLLGIRTGGKGRAGALNAAPARVISGSW